MMKAVSGIGRSASADSFAIIERSVSVACAGTTSTDRPSGTVAARIDTSADTSVGELDVTHVDDAARRSVEQKRDRSNITRLDAKLDQLQNRQTQCLHQDLAGAEDHIGVQQPVKAARQKSRRP